MPLGIGRDSRDSRKVENESFESNIVSISYHNHNALYGALEPVNARQDDQEKTDSYELVSNGFDSSRDVGVEIRMARLVDWRVVFLPPSE